MIKDKPETLTFYTYNYAGIDTFNYCPDKYFVLSSLAVSSPSGRVVCTTIRANPNDEVSYSMTRGACVLPVGDENWYHEMTCARFR